MILPDEAGPSEGTEVPDDGEPSPGEETVNDDRVSESTAQADASDSKGDAKS